MDSADTIPVDNQVNILTYITQLYSARAQVAAQISSASLKAPAAGDYAWLYQVQPCPACTVGCFSWRCGRFFAALCL